MKKRTRLVLTPGDPAGIGYEITLKAIRALRKPRLPFDLIIIGARPKRCPFPEITFTSDELDAEPDLSLLTAKKPCDVVWLSAPTRAPKGLLLAGYQSGWSVVEAAHWVCAGWADGLVTGPISKARLQRGGFNYQGHTDLLEDCWKSDLLRPGGASDAVMMLANASLRVALATTHVPLRKVSATLDGGALEKTIRTVALGLKDHWKITQPRVAVLGLNPHAGEDGRMGHEEQEVISPAIVRSRRALKKHRVRIEGPFPSDTFFATQAKHFDAVIAMYHDQGLIPVKQLDFEHTVNITLGLPWIRTSVDHGTAFDIAGRGIANPTSLIEALKLGHRLSEKGKINVR